MMDDKEVRQQLRDWLAEQVQGVDRFDSRDVVRAGVEHFARDDAWLRAAGTMLLRTTLHRLLKDLIRAMRDEEAPEDGNDWSVFRRMQRWYEHTGRQYVRVMNATRAELLSAADRRQANVDGQLRRIEWLRTVAEPMNNTETVLDRYEAADLCSIWHRLHAAA